MLSCIFPVSAASPFWLAGNWSFNLSPCIRLMKAALNEPECSSWWVWRASGGAQRPSSVPEFLENWAFPNGPGGNAHYQGKGQQHLLMAQSVCRTVWDEKHRNFPFPADFGRGRMWWAMTIIGCEQAGFALRNTGSPGWDCSGAAPCFILSQLNKPTGRCSCFREQLWITPGAWMVKGPGGHSLVELWHSHLSQELLLVGLSVWHSERDFHLPREIKFHCKSMGLSHF